jgi:carbonic anhydrase
MVPASQALERLRVGNRRFASGEPLLHTLVHEARRSELLTGQRPFAVIVGCSDSRVPVEIVFDQGLGDLFVIRVAGNVVDNSQIGSVEFAADHFGTRLVVVLGHTCCGAVQATLEELQSPSGQHSEPLRSIVERIRPAVECLLDGEAEAEPEVLLRQAVRNNVRIAADSLRQGSQVLQRLVRDDGLVVVGAEYSLETGCVDFFEGVPGAE